MRDDRLILDRRDFGVMSLAALISAGWSGTAHASLFGNGGIKGMIGDASDKSLDKLAVPGAFYADTAIRILLPGAKGKLARKLLSTGDKLGVTTKLTKSLNDAAGAAAGVAKPVFRDAINGLSWSDVPSLATQKDGATQYLKKAAGETLTGKVRPLIQDALTKVGAFRQLESLRGNRGQLFQVLGLTALSNDGLTDSVTGQALNGIYSYIGGEEGRLRGNIGGTIQSVLDAVKS